MNNWIGCGNITKDLEVRKTQSGKSVLDFVIACNEGKTQDGRDIVDFVSIQSWGNQAENIAKYLSKGRKILVEGSIKASMYEDTKGKHYKTYVLLNRFEFVDKAPQRQEQGYHEASVQQTITGNGRDACGGIDTFTYSDIKTDDLPFY